MSPTEHERDATEALKTSNAPKALAPSNTSVYTRNVFMTSIRLLVFAAIGLLLPSFLTHHLSSAVYGAWVLILQLANYVSYLDFGAQTAISKYIAELTAVSDHASRNRHASAGAAMTLAGGIAGIGASVVIAGLVPIYFRDMPHALSVDVSRGVLLVGISTAALLATSAIGGIFLGLQRYTVPVLLNVANKLLYAGLLVGMVLMHRSLTVMGASVAIANLLTAAAQVLAWYKLIPYISIRRSLLAWPILKQMLSYCAVLGIWTSGMILISGLDTIIVGRYRFGEVGFYAIAAVPVLFLNQLLSAALSPLVPATSALSVVRTPLQLGALLERGTRYSVLIMLAAGLPLILFGYPLLMLWVGPEYARHSLLLMRILLLATIFRNICLLYCGMVLAIGMQRLTTLSGVCEALVNLACSILLGRRYGAVGVAVGTLIGSLVGLLVHLFASMSRTQGYFAIPAKQIVLSSVLRPSMAALPTLVLLPFIWAPANPSHAVPLAFAWAILSAALFWRAGLLPWERMSLLQILRTKLIARLS